MSDPHDSQQPSDENTEADVAAVPSDDSARQLGDPNAEESHTNVSTVHFHGVLDLREIEADDKLIDAIAAGLGANLMSSIVEDDPHRKVVGMLTEWHAEGTTDPESHLVDLDVAIAAVNAGAKQEARKHRREKLSPRHYLKPGAARHYDRLVGYPIQRLGLVLGKIKMPGRKKNDS